MIIYLVFILGFSLGVQREGVKKARLGLVELRECARETEHLRLIKSIDSLWRIGSFTKR